MVADRQNICPHERIPITDKDAEAVVDEMCKPWNRGVLIGRASRFGHRDPEGAVQDALILFLKKATCLPAPLAEAITDRSAGVSKFSPWGVPESNTNRAKDGPWDVRVRGWLTKVLYWSRPRNASKHDVPLCTHVGKQSDDSEPAYGSDKIYGIDDYLHELVFAPEKTDNQRASIEICRRSCRDGLPITEAAADVAEETGLVEATIRSGAARLNAKIIMTLKSRLLARAAA